MIENVYIMYTNTTHNTNTNKIIKNAEMAT